jgi:hypothetical protein
MYYRARADSRHRIDLVGAVKTNLGDGRAVLLALTITDSWFGVGVDGLVPAPAANDQLQGGHAVVAVGFDEAEQRLLVRNSWGLGWADGGYAWLPYEYLERYGLEAATLVALP